LNRKPEDNEGLIRPTKGKTDPDVGPDAILVMIRSELEYLVKVSKNVASFNMGFFNLYQSKSDKNIFSTLTGPFLGAPQAVMGLEKILALGAKRIWVLGWCGSLQHDLKIGDLVIPSSAVSEEGTSQHYPIDGDLRITNEELNWMLETALQEKGHSFKRGSVWTTDAPYRETPAKIKEYQKKGVLAVEMEMSALMTLAVYRKVKIAGLLVVSDELSGLKWHTGFTSPVLKQRSRFAGELLLELVESLNG
jgi:uridine phosphorylase